VTFRKAFHTTDEKECVCMHTHTCTHTHTHTHTHIHTHTHTHTYTHKHTITQSHSQTPYLLSCDNSFTANMLMGIKCLANITGAGIQQRPAMCITNIVSCAQTAKSYIPSQKKVCCTYASLVCYLMKSDINNFCIYFFPLFL